MSNQGSRTTSEAYTKKISPFLTTLPYEVGFQLSQFQEKQTEKYGKDYDLEDIKVWGVIDYNRYSKQQLSHDTKQFVDKTTYQDLCQRIKALKQGKFLLSTSFPDLQIISSEYSLAFARYINTKFKNKKQKKKPVFQHVQKEHVEFLQSLMEKQVTRNLPITLKLILIQQKFPQLKISRSTLYKMQRKKLNFSQKRITQYKPPNDNQPSKTLKRIAFLTTFLDFMEDESCEFFVIDEVGFGTKPLTRTGYSQIGSPCAWVKGKMLRHNMTCTATISTRSVELLQFFTEGGTTSETFEAYFSFLVYTMRKKYPSKELIFLLDNLKAHKTSLIMKILNNEDHCFLLLTPSCTPQFSPIENMFSQTKKLLSQQLIPTTPGLLALDVSKIMFGFSEKAIQKFYRRTFNNFLTFWFNVKKNRLVLE